MKGYAYYKPSSFEEIWQLQADCKDVYYIAGGTDLMTRIKARRLQPKTLISLRAIPGINEIHGNKSVYIGATTTITELIRNPILHEKARILVEAGRRLGSVQIRNLATIGGNLCNASPCADTATPLLVLDAKINARGPAGPRELKLAEFFKNPGECALLSVEVLDSICFEAPSRDALMLFMKKGRVCMDLAVVSLAMLIEHDGPICKKARLAAGSVAPYPMRLAQVEEWLEGRELTTEQIDGAARLASKTVKPISDVRATEQYRRHMVGVYVKRGLEKVLERCAT